MKNTIFKKTFVLFLQTFFLFITSESLKAEINDVFLIPLFSHIEQERLYNKKAWIKLLHYNKNWLGYKSQVESSIFFNSNEGKINPKSELKSTLRAFFLNPPEDENEHARCRFPARFKWLDQKLNLTKYYKDRLPKISCEALENFKKRAQAKSVSLVFSSYYLNNPASAFGHSFLRLNKKDPTKNKSNEVFELLDQGVNFAANPNTKIPFWYSIGGLMGAFDGSFTMMPYYMKVREYNDFESRDLWSYELNMSEDEVETLILHLWELGPVKFDYYFLSSNCSYQMLTVLEASMPQKDLTSNLPKFWKIPSDTLKSLTSQKALVKQVRFRPSVATKFRYQLEGLDFIQKKILTKSISDKNLNQIKSINDDKKKVEVLDALIGYLEYKYPYDLVLKKSESKNWKHKILLKRSTFPIKTKERKIVIDEKERPDKGHRSQRMGVHYGYHKTQKSYFEFSPRFAFHDLLDKAEGYPKHSHLEVMSWRFRYGFEKKEFSFEGLTVIHLSIFNPYHNLLDQKTIRGGFYIKKMKDKNCKNCTGISVDYGRGVSFDFNGLNMSFIFEGGLDHSRDFTQQEARFFLGPRIQVHSFLGDSFKFQFQSFYHHLFQSKFSTDLQYKLESRWTFKRNHSLNHKIEFFNENYESQLGYYFYF